MNDNETKEKIKEIVKTLHKTPKVNFLNEEWEWKISCDEMFDTIDVTIELTKIFNRGKEIQSEK